MTTQKKDRLDFRLPILHFVSFVGAFLIILTVALSVFGFTSAAGV